MIKTILKEFRWLPAATLMLAGPVMADMVNLPHTYQRENPNLLADPSFIGGGTNYWTFAYAPWPYTPSLHRPDYDSGNSRTLGSGSLHFSIQPDAEQSNYSMVRSEQITGIKHNTPYTISYYLKTQQNEPLFIYTALQQYDANGVEKTVFSGGRWVSDLSYSIGVATTSVPNEWQEVTNVVTISDTTVEKVNVLIFVYAAPLLASDDFFIDDVYFGEGISFAESPSDTRQPWPRTTNPDAHVKIDALGNWSVFEKDQNNQYAWKDFFPFGLYVTNLEGRTSYQSFSDQGFNLVFNQQYAGQIQRAKDAVSDFNPNGMRAGLRLALYASPAYNNDWPLSGLENVIASIGTAGLEDTLLCYEWDNERNWTSWNRWLSMVSTIRTHDANHPIYILNGDAAAQRVFKDLSDVSGTYVGVDPSNRTENGVGKFEILQNLEKQTVPVSIAQLNLVENTTYGFRMRAYDALIKGAKGIVWFGDDDTVENQNWWGSISELREEFDELLPLLKQPYSTTWSASASDEDIRFSIRDLNGEGHMIVMNPAATDSKVTFTLTGMTPSEVWNYFDNQFVTLVNGGTFTVILPAHRTAVYRLSNNTYPESLQNVGMEISGSPLSQWGGYGGGSLSQDTVVKYNGTASARIDNANTGVSSQYQQFFGALKSSTRYRFTAMIKTENVVKNDPNAAYDGAVIQLYTGGQNQFWPLPALAGDNEWRLVDQEFETPASPDANWYVRLRLTNASGTVWFDNVSLKELP